MKFYSKTESSLCEIGKKEKKFMLVCQGERERERDRPHSYNFYYIMWLSLFYFIIMVVVHFLLSLIFKINFLIGKYI